MNLRPGGECSVAGCTSSAHARGVCSNHYVKLRRYGDPTAGPGKGGVTQPLEPRFWSKVDRRGEDECWLWQAGLDPKGYGNFWMDGTTRHAYRVAYELVVGPVPTGLELDHLCRVRACVNPSHLEAVTHQVNNNRGESPSAHHARKTHCIRGHEFTPENTYVPPKAPNKRYCKTCAAAASRRYNRKAS